MSERARYFGEPGTPITAVGASGYDNTVLAPIPLGYEEGDKTDMTTGQIAEIIVSNNLPQGEQSPGYTGPNVAINLKKLEGKDSVVNLVTHQGSDPLGRDLEKDIEAAEVRFHGEQYEGETNASLVVVPTNTNGERGDRAIFTRKATNTPPLSRFPKSGLVVAASIGGINAADSMNNVVNYTDEHDIPRLMIGGSHFKRALADPEQGAALWAGLTDASKSMNGKEGKETIHLANQQTRSDEVPSDDPIELAKQVHRTTGPDYPLFMTFGAAGALVIFENKITVVKAPPLKAPFTLGMGDGFAAAAAYAGRHGADAVGMLAAGVTNAGKVGEYPGAQTGQMTKEDFEQNKENTHGLTVAEFPLFTATKPTHHDLAPRRH